MAHPKYDMRAFYLEKLIARRSVVDGDATTDVTHFNYVTVCLNVRYCMIGFNFLVLVFFAFTASFFE